MTDPELSAIEARANAEYYTPDEGWRTELAFVDIATLIAELRRARSDRAKSYCTWCGLVIEDPDAEARARSITDHILTCVKHPVGEMLTKLEAEIDEHDTTRERLATAEALLKDAERLLNYFETLPHDQEDADIEHYQEAVWAWLNRRLDTTTAPATTGDTSNG